MIKISTKMTPDIIDLRKKCYAQYDYIGYDWADYRVREIIHIKAIQNDKLVGSGRIVFGPTLPCGLIYNLSDLEIRDFEVGRTCIDPDIKNPIVKYKILSEMIKKTIAVCLLTDCNRLFTGANACNSFLYKNLVGFEEVAGPEAYTPCKEKKISLLALNFDKEYTQRKRGFFNLDEKYIEATKDEIDFMGMGHWL